jgi:DNA-binding SARP family transcriptional activator
MVGALIRLYLFGPLAISQGEAALPLPGSTAARALLAYLCLHRQRPQPRAVLAGLFWPDSPEDRARRSLTQALWQIRHNLPEIILTDAECVHVPGANQLWIDVEAFRSLLVAGSDITQPSNTQAETLHQAVQLYRGDLLEGFYDDWLLLERERLRETYLGALERLIGLQKAAGRYRLALDLALTLAGADPLREATHREIMRLHTALDRPQAALKQFEACCQILDDELGLGPEPQTVALARQIAAQAPQEALPYLPLPSPSLGAEPGRPLQVPLIGREEERRQIVAHLEAALRWAGGVVLVEGEAGVGKTRLVQEAARDAEWRGAQVLWGHCQEMESLPPFAPWVEALDGGLSPLRLGQLEHLIDPIWLRALSPLLPALVAHFPGLPPPPALEPARQRERLVNALAQLLAAWGQITPLVLIFEDLHWADQDSLEVFPTLAQRLQQHSVLILGSYRGEDARAQPRLWRQIGALDGYGLRQRLVLSRLEQDAAGELIRRSLGLSQSAPAFESRLYQETDGNPLFILETLQALYDEGLLRRDEHEQWHTPWDAITADYAELPLPPVVERVIDRRLAYLSPDERALLDMAAVLGASFDFRLLGKASQLDPNAILPILGGLVRRHFLVETPVAYRFSHDKIRRVAYDALIPNRLFHLHRQAGEALEALQPDQTAGLAHHFFRAQVWDKAAHYSQLAGEQAAAVYANREAVAHLTHALEASANLPRDPQFEFDLRMAREAALSRLGERTAQAADLAALEVLLQEPAFDTPARRAAVGLRQIDYFDAVSDYLAGMESARKVSHAAESARDLRTAVLALHKWVRMLNQRGEWEAARVQLERADALARASRDGAAQATSLQLLARLHFDQGRFDITQEYCQRALEICPPEADPIIRARVYSLLGTLYHYLADFPTALAYNQKALEVWQMMGDRAREASCLYNRSTILSDSGDYPTARRTLEQVCQLAHTFGDKTVEGYAYVFLGLVLEHLNEYLLARQSYTTGLALRREVGLCAMEIDPLAGLARVATALGDHAAAIEYADEVLTRLGAEGIAGVGDPLLAYLGAYRAMLAAGQRERGLAGLQRAYVILMEFAANISDPERRRAYIHDISPGKHIWNDYQEHFEGRAARRMQARLAHVEAPTGRPLRDEELVNVTWTVAAPEDEAIQNKTLRRQQCLLRLVQEAAAQGGAPTLVDLSTALQVSRATLKRDLAALRGMGHAVKTRGSPVA